jgi:hypothetical protein
VSKNEKLLAKWLNEQMAFTWPELVTLLRRLGYTQIEGLEAASSSTSAIRVQ